MADGKLLRVDKSAEWMAQLAQLRVLTERMGVVHEAQKQQLLLAPFSVDPQIDRHDARIDLDNRIVRYEWESVGRSVTWMPDARYVERLESMAKQVQFLLGGSWQTVVNMNGIQIFPLVGRKPPKNARSKGKPRKKSRRSPKRRR